VNTRTKRDGFTEYELAEWPALTLLVGPHQPTPLRPDQLVMRQNVSDRELGTGMVASGYAYPSLAEAIVFGLVAKYLLPGHQRWLSLDNAIAVARANLDGRVVEPWLDSFMRENINAAVYQVQQGLLDPRFLLCLGTEFHDLDLEEDELWVSPDEQDRRDRALKARQEQSRVARAEEREKIKESRSAAIPRLTVEGIGNGDVITPKASTDLVPTAIATIELALKNKWNPGGKAGNLLGHVRQLLKRTGGIVNETQQIQSIYNLMAQALDHLTEHVAPEGYQFEYAYGYLTVVMKQMPYPKPGVVIDEDGFDNEHQMALEIIDWARMVGRPTDEKWRKRLWRQDYEPMSRWGEINLDAFLDEADKAMDWLNKEFAREEQHSFEVSPTGSFVLVDYATVMLA
jgi:hypothetical protein